MADQLTIKPAKATLKWDPTGSEDLEFVAYFGKDALSALSAVEWSLADKDGNHVAKAETDSWLGIVNDYGGYGAADAPPVDAKGVAHPDFRVKAKYKDDTGKSHEAYAEVAVRLVWPEAWPWLASPTFFDAWSGDLAERVAAIAYDLFLQMPDGFMSRVEQVAMCRSTATGRSFHFPIPRGFVVFGTGDLDPTIDAGFPLAGRPQYGEHETGSTVIHELSHAVMTHQCGGGLIATKALLNVINLGAMGMFQGAAVGAAIFALPLLPYVVLGALADYTFMRVISTDFMSEWADPQGWKTNDVSAFAIPLLGLFAPWTNTVPPSVITAFRGGPVGVLFGGNFMVNLRNDAITAAEKALNVTDPPSDAHMLALIDRLDAVSYYGLTDPHEDWAETCTEMTFGEAHLNTFHSSYKGTAGVYRPANKARRDRVIDAEIFPPASEWKGAIGGAKLGEYGKWKDRIDWRFDKRKVEEDPMYALGQLAIGFAEGTGKLLAKLWEIVRNNPYPPPRPEPGGPEPPMPLPGPRGPDDPTTIDYLRMAEVYGDGLRRYAGADQPGAEGDALTMRDDALWVVTKVDGEGRVSQATGAYDVTAKTTMEDLRLDRAEVRYQWTPATQPRRFSDGPLHDALVGLVDWWGREEVEQGGRRQPRPVGDYGTFFTAAVDATGLRAGGDFDLPKEDPRVTDVRAYCDTHGAGLQPFTGSGVEVGDWIGFFDENIVGIVTRVRDGAPVDALVGGSIPLARHGTYRDAAGGDDTVKMLHAIDPGDVRWTWRPSTETRRFGGPMTDTLPELERGLNNLLFHADRSEIERGGRRRSVTNTPLLTHFLLLTEQAAAPDARKAWNKLSWSQGEEEALWRYIYTHGEPTGRTKVAPGQLVVWRRGNTKEQGVVVEARDGTATKLVGGEDTVTVFDGEVAPEAILEAWTPSTEPRRHEGDLAAFYGAESALFDLVDRMFALQIDKHGGTSFIYAQGYDLGRSVARAAPRLVRDRVWGATDLETLRDRVDTLGGGVREPPFDGPLPVGAWCFVRTDDFAIVLTVDPEGRPVMGLTPASEGLVIAPIDLDDVRAVWIPSVTPRKYTGATHPLWEDLDTAIGGLRVWGEAKVETDGPLFLDEDVRGLMAGDWAKQLRRGPGGDDEDAGWAEFLDELGDLSDGGATPGDLLLLDGGVQGIVLDAGEALVRRNGAFAIRPLAKARRWRPA